MRSSKDADNYLTMLFGFGLILVLMCGLFYFFHTPIRKIPTFYLIYCGVSAVGFLYALGGVSSEAFALHRAKLKACSHGRRGADANWSKCPQCTVTHFENEAKQAEAERLDAEAEEQRLITEEREKKQFLIAQALRREQIAKENEALQEKWLFDIRQGAYLRSIDPQDFERLISILYARLGYDVRTTQYTGDGGVDIFAYKASKLYVIQCKRVKGSVGEPVLRDLFGTMQHENASGGIVVTTGKVSAQARRWIVGKPIQVVELERLIGLINTAYPAGVAPAEFAPDYIAISIPKPTGGCPECGKPLVKRQGRRGSFYGCKGFPECRYTKPYFKVNSWISEKAATLTDDELSGFSDE